MSAVDRYSEKAATYAQGARQRLRLRIALCSLVLCCLLSCVAQPSRGSRNSMADGRIKLHVCISATSGVQAVPVYALQKGIFARHGLDVTLISIDSGSRAVAALISGSVQLCQMAGSAVVHAVVAGADLAIIGTLVNTYMHSLMVSTDIRSPSDLKGKAVATTTAGSAVETATRVALRTLGLRPDRDVALLTVGGTGERMAALEAGYVAGTVLSVPETILARQRGFHPLLDMSTMGLPNLHTGTVTSRAFLRSNRTTVLNFMKAITEAAFLIKRDREGTLAALSRHTQLDIQKDAAVLGETYEVLRRKLVDIPYPALAGVDAILAEIAHENPGAARFKPEDVADLSVVRELETSGFFRDLLGRK